MTATDTFPPERARRHKLAVAAILGVALLAVFTIWQAWPEPDYTIKFIVPDGYRGVVILEEDADHGVVPTVEAGDVYTYRIPSSGRLTVKSFDLFRQFHADAAQYENGETLRTMTPKKGTAPNGNSVKDIVLRGLGSSIREREQMIISVGDYADCQRHAYEYGFTTTPPDPEANQWKPPLPRPWW